jgi:hypothetical protein
MVNQLALGTMALTLATQQVSAFGDWHSLQAAPIQPLPGFVLGDFMLNGPSLWTDVVRTSASPQAVRPSFATAQTAASIYALEQLAELKSLPQNWDGEHANKPDVDSIGMAAAFVEADPWRAWQPTLHSDGRAMLELQDDHLFVELLFGPGPRVGMVSQQEGGPTRVREVPADPVMLVQAVSGTAAQILAAA